MTDARFPDRWLSDRRFMLLSDAAYRLYATGLLWSVSNRLDGRLTDDDLDMLPRVTVGCTTELAAAGLWKRTGSVWHIVDYRPTQTSASELRSLDEIRRRDRERKATKRAAAAGKPVSADSPVDSPVDSSVDTKGKDRQGQIRLGTEEGAPVAERGWPEVARLGGATN